MQSNIVWFHEDLRCQDNPVLFSACQLGHITPLYILDTQCPYSIGEASKVWLHHALIDLNTQLNQHMVFLHGDPLDHLPSILATNQIDKIFCQERFDPYGRKLHQQLKNILGNDRLVTINSKLLWHPDNINTLKGEPYRVFTPFFHKGCLNATPPAQPLAYPDNINTKKHSKLNYDIDQLKLLPAKNWTKSIISGWDISEAGAQKQLDNFLNNALVGYKKQRDYPSKSHTSQLSPYIKWGQLSVQTIWAKIHQPSHTPAADLLHFKSELGWREFCYYLLYHFPHMIEKNLNPKFDQFPWAHDPSLLEAWQQGQTGYPIIDAAMRQLYSTGYMHNRLRMVTASFLIKNLNQHWHHGQAWFWDCLFDADIASNSAGWQWVAGCGADAAPYFRIFNPILQAQKFDAEGKFIHKWVPELSALSPPYIFQPWKASKEILERYHITLGEDYPNPIIDLETSRKSALKAYTQLKSN